MIAGRRIVVVIPAYRAARTLHETCKEIDRSVVDDVIVVDDCSDDETVAVCRELGLEPLVHDRNRGYGANQKTCYGAALAQRADVVVMLHGDYQYTPRLVPTMAAMIADGPYDVVLGSRILGGGALPGGMPLHRYVANRALTLVENLATGAKLSEYHTGYRAFSSEVLRSLPLSSNSDDFAFDAEILAQSLHGGWRVGEVSCPTRYEARSSSISLRQATRYGLAVLRISAEFAAWRAGLRVGRTLSAVERKRGGEHVPAPNRHR